MAGKRVAPRLFVDMTAPRWAPVPYERYLAMQAVVKAARRYRRAYEQATDTDYRHDAWGIARALDRLARASGARDGRKAPR